MPNYAFTQQVRTALARAQEQAVRLQHDQVGPEHILLGICDDRTVGAILRRLGVDPEVLRRAVEAQAPRGHASRPRGKHGYSPHAKKVLQHAMAAARDDKDLQIRPAHFLVALLRPETGLAAEVLRQSGVATERVKPLLSERESPGWKQFRVEIDDSSDRSIYEQIIAQITEAVATGELRPGDRLPTVRQQADQLDVAPGTVARAYSELEQQGVVITEGVRGTRIADRRDPPMADDERPETLAGLLRPVAVAAFHLGASAGELREALEKAMRGIFDKRNHAG